MWCLFIAFFATAVCALADLPVEQWNNTNIGHVFGGGTSSYSSSTGTFTLRAAGAGVSDTTDNCYFVHQSAQGNVEICAKIKPFQNTTPKANAGIMLRESTYSSAICAYVSVSMDQGIRFTTRSTTGSTTTLIGSATVTSPVWLKLVRSGLTATISPSVCTLSSYYSNNGVSWMLLGTQTLTMSSSVNVGLAMASNDAVTASSVSFDSASVLVNVPQRSADLVLWLRGDVGITVDANNRVSQWQDQSGNNNHATQATTSSQPQLIPGASSGLAGLPVIRFNSATSSCLTISDSSSLNPASGKISMIAIARRTSGNSVARILSKTSGSSGYALDFPSLSQVRSLINGTSAATDNLAGGNFGVIEGIYDQVRNKIYVNESAFPPVNDYAASIVSNTSTLGIGADAAGSNYLDGDIAEILIFNKALTDTERHDLESYLYLKYGVGTQPSVEGATISVPSGTYTTSQTVTMTSPAGTTIYYTTDGSDPTTSSFVYSGAITVSSNTTIKAIAAQYGYQSSGVVSSTIVIDPGSTPTATVTTSGLVLWLKADSGVTTSSGLVSQWNDQSGHGNYAAQATASYRPTYVSNAINGLPVIRFDGSNDCLPTNMTNWPGGTEFSIFVVAKGATYQSLLRSQPAGSSGSYYHVIYPHDSNVFLYSTTITERFALDSGMVMNQWNVGYASYKVGGRMQTYCNGAMVADCAAGINPVPTNLLVLGCYLNGVPQYCTNADVAEIICYNRELTDAERRNVELYLYQKYGVGGLPIAEKPSINLKTGLYSGLQTITITGTDGATIYYTLDSTIPTTSSANFSGTLSVSITTSATIKAMAVQSGYINSDIAVSSITLDYNTGNVIRDGLVAWYRGDVGVISNGSTISQWNDQSGNGNHALQTTTSKQPTLIGNTLNGWPVVRFSSANATVLAVAENAALNPSFGKVSMIAVAKRSSGTATARMLSKLSGDSGYGLDFTSGTTVRSCINNTNSATATLTASTFGVVEGIYDQSANKIYLNAGTPATSAYTVAVASNSSSLGLGGDAAGGSYLDGDIAEILLYDHALTDVERQGVEIYLYERYGLGTVPKTSTPSSDLSSGLYGSTQTVTLSGPVGGAIYYTLDGSNPTRDSLLYLGTGLPIDNTLGSTTTLKIRSVVDGSALSDVVTYTYTVDSNASNISKTGMALWLRADVGITTNSGKVAQWIDQSGNGYVATQPTTTSQPLLVTGELNYRPVVRFNSSSSTVLVLSNSGSLNSPTGQVSVMAVTRRSGGSGTARIVSKYSAATGYGLGFDASTTVSSWINGSTVTSGKALDSYGLVESIYDQTQQQVYLWGGVTGSASYSTAVSGNATLVGIGGNASGTNILDGEIAELIVYNRAITPAERQNIELYLRLRYGDGIIQEKLVNPTISVSSALSDANVTVTLSGPVGVPLYFTVDGSDPNIYSMLYSVPISIGTNTTLKVRAIQNGMRSSDVIAKNIKIDPATVNVVKNGLALWLRADIGVTSTSGVVSQWEDQSGYGNHATQSVSTKQPAWVDGVLNNCPVVRFNSATSTVLTVTDSASLNPASGKLSLIAVTKRASGTATARIVSKLGTTSGYALDWTSGTAVRSFINNANAASTSLAANTYGIIEAVYDQALNKIYLNGGTPVTTTYSTALAANSTTLGVGGDVAGGNVLDGDIAELLIYDRPITDSERRDLEAYLYGRYHIGTAPVVDTPTISVPSGTYINSQTVTFTGQAGVTLYFTTDGSTPTTSSAVYTTPFTISANTTVRVLAVKYGYQNSEVVSSNIEINQDAGITPAVTTSGLVLWLKADAGVTTASGVVSQWNDQSGNGNYAAQATASYRPTYVSNVINGLPVIRFDGSNDCLPTNMNNWPGGTEFSIFVVAKGANYQSLLRSQPAGSAGSYYYVMYPHDTNVFLVATSSSEGLAINSGMVANQWNVGYASYKVGGRMKTYCNGAMVADCAAGVNPVPTNLLVLGCYLNGVPQFCTNADVAEIICYNRQLTDTERRNVELYIYQKYGVGNIQVATAPTISLASGTYGSSQTATLSATTGAVIRYTLDGTLPTANSPQYTGALNITSSCTIQAVALEQGKAVSTVTSRTIVIDPAATNVPRSGMTVWWRADYGVTRDTNSYVSGWQDQSGSGHDATVTNTEAQPLYMAGVVNGRPVVRFDGVNDYLTTSYSWPGGSEFSVFVVTKGSNYQSLIRAQDGDYVVYPWGNGAFIMSSDGGTDNGVSSGLVASQWNVGTAIYKVGDRMATYRNGALVGDRAAGTNALPSKTLMLGSFLGTSEFLNADVAEVLIYNRALSSTERQQVEAYLQHKYIDADSDSNGISDAWEMQHFGKVGIDPQGDADGDGVTNLQEFQQGTDPTNFYNGAAPTLRIVGGNDQTSPCGTYASTPLSVQVVNGSGQILSKAPVQYRVTSTTSDGKLALVGAVGATTATTMNVTTGVDGWGSVYALVPTTVVDMTVEVNAVGISATPVTFTIHSASGTVATPSIVTDPNYLNVNRTATISCATSGADIRYTVDGSQPTLSSIWIGDNGVISTTGKTLIRVKAFKTGYNPSAERTLLVMGQPSIVQLLAHGHYSVFKDAAGRTWTWGDNSCGQQASSAVTSQSAPIQSTNIDASALVDLGDYHMAGILSTTSATAWSVGANWFGQLGNGTTVDSSTPIAVPTVSSLSAISGGSYHTLALRTDKTVWAWGANWYGQLGDSTTAQRLAPVQVSGLTNATAIAAGGVHSLALKSDGTVWAWGGNAYGQLGLDTTVDHNTPAQVTSLSGITAIACGGVHNLALKSDGTVWAWGSNDYGQLGDGTATQRHSVVQVMTSATTTLTNVTAIAAGRYHSFAITQDGKLWVWGCNWSGQLGDSTNISKPYATALTSLTNVLRVAGGYNHSLALTADGTLWAWGDNSLGQLGTGDFVNRTVPTRMDFSTDSDGDGLSDFYEIAHGYNPLLADSNNDGINDAVSEAMGIDPTNPDSDGDGVSNDEELLRGTNPLVKEAAPVAVPGDTEAPFIQLHRPSNATALP